MASSTQDEEDLNKDTKHEDDDKILTSESESESEPRSEAKKQKVEPEVKDANQEEDDKMIVASESATSEQEAKDANQEDQSRGGMMPSRSLTQEEEEKAREKNALGAAILVSMSYDVPPKNPSVLEIDDYEEDDSEQTLRFLSRWKAPETPPEKILHRSLVEQCSRPIQMQLTTSDVRQNKLSLSRKKFQQFLDEPGKKETRASVYGPDGKVHEIWFRDDEERSFELTIGWRQFVVEYELKECCDFVALWMFRHTLTQRICLAVDAIRFAFRIPVSKRISDAAFQDSD